jgi:hypothetical protein
VTALLLAVVMGATACSSSPRSKANAGPDGTTESVPDAFGSGVFITSVWSDPWVAVGWTAGPDGAPATACFRSPEGRRWSPCGVVPIDTDGYQTRLMGIARIGNTLLAGGVATGALHGNPRPYLFAGPVDGPLRQLNLARELFGGENIVTYAGLTAGPLGGYSVGTYIGITNQTVAQVWRTTNGSDWRREDGVAALTGSPDEIVGGRAVAVGSQRVVVVGSTVSLRNLADGDDGAVWWSDDGSSWSRAGLTGASMGGPGQQELRTVAALRGTGFVAGGSTEGSAGTVAALWSSPDGQQWRPAGALPAGRGPGATVTALAQGAGYQWAAGVVGGTARLWSSSDGRRWTLRPLPASTWVGAARSVVLGDAGGRLLVVVQGTRGSYAAMTEAS